MLRPLFSPAILTVLLAGLPTSVFAEGTKTSQAFDRSGVIVDLHTFFTAAGKPDSAASESLDETAGRRALVTEDGVYAFLETPQNQQALSGTENGSVVHVKGKEVVGGKLLHIDALEKRDKVPLIDFARFRNDAGQPVALKGVNLCQCGLDVADLPHSCQLGHLHHLQAEDGMIYHYLPFAQGTDAFLGKDSHFKPVEVKGRLLPGQYLLVDAVSTEE